MKQLVEYLKIGKEFAKNPFHIKVKELNEIEFSKEISRTDIINFILSNLNRETSYLEIGVRDPKDNFNKIISHKKYSVDPGIEHKENPVDFKMTSDYFFKKASDGELFETKTKFDVIFIDGLHLADQVDRDINNALHFLKNDGFIVLHDCNPPSEWHAREEHTYYLSPAGRQWNGTTWKAFVKWRQMSEVFAACVDTDWGVGIISKGVNLGITCKLKNEFFEFEYFKKNRKEFLNLISFSELKSKLSSVK